MDIGVLLVEINNRKGGLAYNTKNKPSQTTLKRLGFSHPFLVVNDYRLFVNVFSLQ